MKLIHVLKKMRAKYGSTFAFLIFNFINTNSAQAESSYISPPEKETLIINISDSPKIPWDTIKAGVHTAETFSAAVHGSITPMFELGSKNISNERVLLDNYSCEQFICNATLKKGIIFQNNREVNAYDLEFSLIRQLLSKDGSNFAKSILDDIVGIDNIDKENIKYITYNKLSYPINVLEGIKVIDNYNIQFKLKRENKVFFKRISDGRLPIVPIEELENDFLKWKKYPVGFGPYKVTGADFINFEFYLQKVSEEDNIPKYVKLIYGSEKGGDIKILLSEPKRVPNEDDKVIIFANVHNNAGFLYNYQTKLARNKNFRKAISLALDRNKIAEASAFKELQAEDQMLPNSSWQQEYRSEIKIQTQNVKEAKRLLNLVPHHLWKNKVFQVPTYWGYSDNVNTLPYVIEIKKQLKEIGIETNFLDTDNAYDKFTEGDTNVLYFTGFGFSYKDPNRNFGHFRKGSYFTYESPNDPKFEELYQLSTKYVKETTKYTKLLSQYFTENNVMTIVFNQRMSLSFNSKKIISLGNQYNGIRLAIWEIKLKED